MTTMMKKLGTAALAAVLFTISAAGAAAFATSVRDDRVETTGLSATTGSSGDIPAFLKGKVHDASAGTASLEKKIDQARADFAKSGGGTVFFAAYEFVSRTRFRHGSYTGPVSGFTVGSKEARIRIEDKGRGNKTVSVDGEVKDAAAPAGMLLLYDTAKGAAVRDVGLLDLDQTYEFSDAPVYWLGRADGGDSIGVLEKSFDATKDDAHVLDALIFSIGCHDGPQARVFLKKTALGPREAKIREKAVFWIGNAGDAVALSDLKEIYAKERTESVKKQIIFAMQLSKRSEAVEELIRIARQDASTELRKQAIFWIGQKASAECVKALKDIVDAPDGEKALKDQAVFAISQLPKDKSVPMLIDLAKANKSVEVRKKAIFWLGQSGDPAALKFFEDILLKK
jgi:hypothetical protein